MTNDNKIGQIYATFDNGFNLVSKIIFASIKRLSPYATAILPGTLFGYTIFAFFMEFTGNYFVSIATGFSAFIVLESAGIWSGHKIAEYIGEKRVWIPITTFVLYFLIGVGTLWLLDGSINSNVKLVGTAIFALAGVIYILFGLQSYQERMENKEKREKRDEVVEKVQEENRQFEREQEALDREAKRKNEAKLVNAEARVIVNGGVVATTIKQDGKPQVAYQYNKQKMKALKVAIMKSPNASKSELAKAVGISRPTLDKYLQVIEEEK